MQLTVPGVSFVIDVDGTSVKVADTPRLRFFVEELKVDKNTGKLAAFELPEPRYDDAEDLLDKPITDHRIRRPLPAYPTDLKEATGAWIFSSDELVLDIWLQGACAYMTHLCKSTERGRAKPVKPLYRFEAGVALRFKVKADREVWTRQAGGGRTAASLGSWTKNRVEEGKWKSREEGITWGNHVTLNELIPQTPCIPLPKDEPRNSWSLLAPRLVRSIALPYRPGQEPPRPS